MRSDLPGQTALAQTESRLGDLARRKAAALLKPQEPQKPLDIGLFSDEASQLDLIEMFMD